MLNHSMILGIYLDKVLQYYDWAAVIVAVVAIVLFASLSRHFNRKKENKNGN